MTTIPAPAPRHAHICPKPYAWLFTDELPGYTPPTPEELEWAPWRAEGRTVSIDNPRYEDGRLWQCPTCERWWVFTRGETPPTRPGYTERSGMVQCITTYAPAWHRVRWYDWDLRRRIRKHAEAQRDH